MPLSLSPLPLSFPSPSLSSTPRRHRSRRRRWLVSSLSSSCNRACNACGCRRSRLVCIAPNGSEATISKKRGRRRHPNPKKNYFFFAFFLVFISLSLTLSLSPHLVKTSCRAAQHILRSCCCSSQQFFGECVRYCILCFSLQALSPVSVMW